MFPLLIHYDTHMPQTKISSPQQNLVYIIQIPQPTNINKFDTKKEKTISSHFPFLSNKNMSSLIFLLFILISQSLSLNTELDTLMLIKDSLDPENHVLLSWNNHSDPCSGTFEGVACNEQDLVTNISLQGKGLSGEIPSVIGKLKSLTGLYLHFNALNGILPKEIAGLTQLSDLYLNVNNLSGFIPHEIGNMSNLQGWFLIFYIFCFAFVIFYFLFLSLKFLFVSLCVIINHYFLVKVN